MSNRITTDADIAWIVIRDLCRNGQFEKARLEIVSIQSHKLLCYSTIASLFHYVLVEALGGKE